MRGIEDVCGCFPTGRHYPGIAELLAQSAVRVAGLAREFATDRAWAAQSFCVIDFETTGLDAENERVVEMGVVVFEAGAITARRQWLIDPEKPIPAEATSVHGIGDDDVKGAPKFRELAEELLALLEARIPVAYNAEFDRRFLHAEFTRAGHAPGDARPPALRPDVVWVDPLVWVRELQKYEKGKKLTDVAARLGIPLDNAHRADADAEAAGRVLLALAPQMPSTYGELVRLQAQYAVRQEADFQAWRARKGG
jgi:DNA polymerase-3 subunit epsilon